MRSRMRAAIATSPLPLLLLLLTAPAAQAQGFNLTGSWSILMEFTPPGSAPKAATLCSFEGSADVVQAGSAFTGDIAVNKIVGGMTCPSSMSATLTGNVTGNQVSMGAVMGGGAFGQATFTGTLVAGAAPRGAGATTAAARTAATGSSGTFTVTSGPFTGIGGTWFASQQPSIAAVPALGGKGLAALALLLLAAAFWFLLRRSAQQRL